MNNENLTDEQRAQLPADAPELLTTDDLQAFQTIIDIATRRGTFQATELSMVGKIYDKLSAFNAYVKKQVEKETETKEEV